MTRHVTRMTIDDAEHFSPAQRQAIIDSYPVHERDARVKGLPALGSGRIFPIDEDKITVEPFLIPNSWAQIGGIDFGYDHPTAAVRMAHDRDSDVVYITACYKVSEQPPIIHASTLKTWGKQLPWAWPHDALKRDSQSGDTLKADYEAHGLYMLPERAQFEDGKSGVEAGLMIMLERMMAGRLKVFRHCNDWLDEFRIYHRNKGLVVKQYDDLMDATRYAIMSIRYAQSLVERELPKRDNSWVV
jgi:hypothetical protein